MRTVTNTITIPRVGRPEGTFRILVWDLPVRVFHWVLAASFAGAYWLSESERLRNIHVKDRKSVV